MRVWVLPFDLYAGTFAAPGELQSMMFGPLAEGANAGPWSMKG
jgi:hypothetical protein